MIKLDLVIHEIKQELTFIKIKQQNNNANIEEPKEDEIKEEEEEQDNNNEEAYLVSTYDSTTEEKECVEEVNQDQKIEEQEYEKQDINPKIEVGTVLSKSDRWKRNREYEKERYKKRGTKCYNNINQNIINII